MEIFLRGHWFETKYYSFEGFWKYRQTPVSAVYCALKKIWNVKE